MAELTRRSSATKPFVTGCPAVKLWLRLSPDLGLTPETLRSWRKQLTCGEQISDCAARTEQQNNTHELALAREIGQLKKEWEAMTRQRGLASATSYCRLSESSRKTGRWAGVFDIGVQRFQEA